MIHRIEGEEKTKGGIIIPDTAKKKPQYGEVIAVGPGAGDESGKLVPLDEKAGDRVVIHIDDQELSLREFGRLLGVHAGWGMRIAFVPEEFVTDNPTVKIRKPQKRKR